MYAGGDEASRIFLYFPCDANASNTVDIADAVYTINYVFKGGPEPCCP